MNQLLNRGQKVVTEMSGCECEVGAYLGGGGQGEVYRATLTGKPVALKWYFSHNATAEQRTILETLVRKGAPSESFLWPLDLAFAEGRPGFGYLMQLRDDRFRSLFDLMKRTVEPSFKALLTTAIKLSHSFHQLHAKGFCYCDISFGNVFFAPDTGDVLICDNDNVVVDGSETGIRGTPDFMAPEIVRGEKTPCIATDRFSLAVLLFYLLHIAHPLFGKRVTQIHALDLPARRELCGENPVFIFDPEDRSNEALPKEQDPLGESGANACLFWPIYPHFVRETFTKAFTEGVRDPENGRVMETVWQMIMSRARDSLFYCPSCDSENFYDPSSAGEGGGGKPCWQCARPLRWPPRIRIGKHVIMLNHDTQLFPHHLSDAPTFDFSSPVAEVTRHPDNPRLWGLTNRSDGKWVCNFPDGSAKDAPPGRSVPLNGGIKIHFGTADGELRF